MMPSASPKQRVLIVGAKFGEMYLNAFIDAPRDKCAHFREINGIAAAFQHLQKNYIPAALSFL